jgi:hypothetical protein
MNPLRKPNQAVKPYLPQGPVHIGSIFITAYSSLTVILGRRVLPAECFSHGTMTSIYVLESDRYVITSKTPHLIRHSVSYFFAMANFQSKFSTIQLS